MTLATQTPRVCCATPAPAAIGRSTASFESSGRQLRRRLSGYGLIVGLLVVAARDMTTKPSL